MSSFFGLIHLLRKRSEQLLLWTQITRAITIPHSFSFKLRKKLVIFYKMLIRDDLRRIGIHFAQMGFAHDDWADSRV